MLLRASRISNRLGTHLGQFVRPINRAALPTSIARSYFNTNKIPRDKPRDDEAKRKSRDADDKLINNLGELPKGLDADGMSDRAKAALGDFAEKTSKKKGVNFIPSGQNMPKDPTEKAISSEKGETKMDEVIRHTEREEEPGVNFVHTGEKVPDDYMVKRHGMSGDLIDKQILEGAKDLGQTLSNKAKQGNQWVKDKADEFTEDRRSTQWITNQKANDTTSTVSDTEENLENKSSSVASKAKDNASKVSDTVENLQNAAKKAKCL